MRFYITAMYFWDARGVLTFYRLVGALAKIVRQLKISNRKWSYCKDSLAK